MSLCLREIASRLIHGGKEPSGIDLEQQVALLDEATFRVCAAKEIAGHLRAYLRVHHAFRRADPLAIHRNVSLDDLRDLDFRRDSSRHRAVFSTATAHERQCQ